MGHNPLADRVIELRQLELLRTTVLVDHPFGVTDNHLIQRLPALGFSGWRYRLFLVDLPGWFVAALGNKRGLTHHAFAGPFGEFHFRHQRWFDPLHTTGNSAGDRRIEW